MESALFILNALVVVVAVVMSLRDERLGPGQRKTSYFRYLETAPPAGRDGDGRGGRKRRAAGNAVAPRTRPLAGYDREGGRTRSGRARTIGPA